MWVSFQMSVDPEMLSALSDALDDLRTKPHQPIPCGVLEALAPLATSGADVKIDLEASRVIGAPLVLVNSRTSDEELLAPLTPRQKQVAELIIQGRSNKQIALEFDISLATVKDHVHAILQRLGMPSRQAVIAASRAVK
ncbi:MAG: response regulator transcription factor [Roseibium sp.]|uniref:helix-turn-helix domain-containing protein n=2 Tax=Roseibium sp. TaxID=1936156 RepID=UPI001B25327D|nr:LuxR C-terminal-related transcriptional regulator [Roseibium sp.]MBO6893844.1 response regulator transcription factor [Roseibium sp.]MBO6932540.1 response regulator transcription factor [Roseibium sp.]